jgi:hypothetical protein
MRVFVLHKYNKPQHIALQKYNTTEARKRAGSPPPNPTHIKKNKKTEGDFLGRLGGRTRPAGLEL